MCKECIVMYVEMKYDYVPMKHKGMDKMWFVKLHMWNLSDAIWMKSEFDYKLSYEIHMRKIYD